jgi:membrane protease YdiL (CAAX protease family)
MEGSEFAEGRPAGFLDAIFFISLLLVCEFVLWTIVGLTAHVRSRGNLLWAVEKIASFALIYFVIRKRLGGFLGGYVGALSAPAAAYGLVIAGVLGIDFFMGPIDELLRGAISHFNWYGNSYDPRDIVGTFLGSIIIAPAIEEFLFRGVVLRGFSRNYPIPTALVLSSLLFALFHHNPAQFIGPFCSGVLFGAAFLRGKSILPCLVGHMLTNGIWFLAKSNADASELLSVGVSGDEPAALIVRVTLGILLAALSISLLLRVKAGHA